MDLRKADPAEAFTRVALPDSPALPFLFAVSDLPELLEPVEGTVPVPSVVNGRLEKDGEVDRYRVKVEPGEKLLIELQARELGTSRLEGILTAYDSAGKKLDSAGDQPLPEDVFAIQGTSRTSSDPFLNLTVPPDVHEIVLTVEDLARRGGPAYGYRLMTRRQAEDFRLSLGSPFVNLPAGGTVVFSVIADRRGFDGPIQLTVADLPKGIHVDGGTIPREYMDASNARTFNRRGILTLTAEPGRRTAHRPTANLGRGQAGRRHRAAPPRARLRHGDRRGRRHRTGRGGPPASGDRAVARRGSAGRAGGRRRGHARSAPDQSQADGGRRALRVRVQVDGHAAGRLRRRRWAWT